LHKHTLNDSRAETGTVRELIRNALHAGIGVDRACTLNLAREESETGAQKSLNMKLDQSFDSVERDGAK